MLGFALLGFVPNASAATLSVCSTCTYTTIASALTASATGDTVSVGAGTWSETLSVEKAITLSGAGTTTNITGLVTVTNIGSTVTIKNLKITGSTSGSGRRCVRVTSASTSGLALTLDTITCTGAAATGGSTTTGGGVDFSAAGTLTVKDSTFTSNAASSHGGAIAMNSGPSSGTALTVTGSTFSSNSSTGGMGGAIYSTQTVSIASSTFTSNAASATSGSSAGFGAAVYANKAITVSGATFTSNAAGQRGGGVYTTSADVDVLDSTFQSNTARWGGGLYAINFSTLEARRNRFIGNSTSTVGSTVATGGAMFVACSSCTASTQTELSNNIYAENAATSGYGGAIYFSDKVAALKVDNNDFLGNNAGYGSGIYIEGAGTTLSAQNNVFYQQQTGTVVQYSTTPTSTPTFAYNSLYNGSLTNTSPSSMASGTGNLTSDPALSGYSRDAVHTNDSYVPTYFPFASRSTTYDAGNSSSSYNDPDGSRNDIGALGGPNGSSTAAPWKSWSDGDADTYIGLYDCDDTLSSKYPTSYYADSDSDKYGSGSAVLDCSAITGYVTDKTDCDDTRAAVNPAALEYCSTTYDDDCDGSVNEASATDATTYYADSDGDKYGSSSSTSKACTVPTGYVSNSTDCDDAKAAVYPGATEYCSTSYDDDCDGTTNESDASDVSTWYLDADGDKYGSSSSTSKACTVPTGYVSDKTDCDDAKKAVYPGASEYCSTSFDDDCDGTINESSAADASSWWPDADSDGCGDSSKTATPACSTPTGYVPNAYDCNDADATIYADATEVCDSKDNDCDLSVDEGVTATYYRDADGDTYGDAGITTAACAAPTGYGKDASDCDDAASTVYPGAAETCGDGVDADCDGAGGPTDDDDGDGLSYRVESSYGGDDCDNDADADGVADGVEFGSGTSPADTDGDGRYDFIDTDDDNDGLSTARETEVRTDAYDSDTDDDGFTDGAEVGTSAFDTDKDGLIDAVDADDDGDLLPTATESSVGTNPYKGDTDGDGYSDYLEVGAGDEAPDTDGDGQIDAVDMDDDGDGLFTARQIAAGSDAYLADSDYDNVPDGDEFGSGATARDSDRDGVVDLLDDDDDGDGLSTYDEGYGSGFEEADCGFKNDGVPPYLDTDSDGDGTLDRSEGSASDDTDRDGLPNFLDCADTDGGTGDTDKDGLSNLEERAIGTSPNDPDSDDDGVADGEEAPDADAPRDTDEDGLIDALDTDDDGDGLPSSFEGVGDWDGDGVADAIDDDDDGDGIPTAEERGVDVNDDGVLSSDEAGLDGDGDGLPDPFDGDEDGTPDDRDDDDNDGPFGDLDGDGLGNLFEKSSPYLNERSADSDIDGVPDGVEAGPDAEFLQDADADGSPDVGDADDDGDSLLTKDESSFDVDADGVPNHLDADADADGRSDLDEARSNPPDPDCDGAPAWFDADETDGPCMQTPPDDGSGGEPVFQPRVPSHGCATVGGGAAGWVLFATALLFGIRRGHNN
jgi:predicted outer membrane repeat protein